MKKKDVLMADDGVEERGPDGGMVIPEPEKDESAPDTGEGLSLFGEKPEEKGPDAGEGAKLPPTIIEGLDARAAPEPLRVFGNHGVRKSCWSF